MIYLTLKNATAFTRAMHNRTKYVLFHMKMPCIFVRSKKRTAYAVLIRATDGTRTRDLHLGKVAYYQLYYYRISYFVFSCVPRNNIYYTR